MITTEKLYLRIGEVAQQLGVTTKTIRRWERKGKIKVDTRTEGNHRRFSIEEIENIKRRQFKGYSNNLRETFAEKEKIKIALVYGRVSTGEQKEDLNRQIELLVKEAEGDNYKVMGIYKDVGSGLNDKRTGLRRMIRE